MCKGTLKAGHADLTLRRDRSVVVGQAVPALVCENCGEASLSAQVAKKVNAIASRETARGVALEFCKFAA